MDEDRLAKEFVQGIRRLVLWLKITAVVLLIHGLAVLMAAGIVWTAAGELSLRIYEAVAFVREQWGIWNGR